MKWTGIVKSQNYLVNAAIKFFNKLYENPQIKISDPIDTNLEYRPSLHFKATNHLTIAAEASEDSPYPMIFNLRHADIMNFNMPIALYCICPEEEFLKQENQGLVRDLQKNGFGLITVDSNEIVTKRFNCIPLIQHISEEEFSTEIRELPRKLRLRMRESFDLYNNNQVSGLQSISEIAEALINDAGKKAVKNGWISRANTNNSASILDSLSLQISCKNAWASIGGMRSFMKEYRNISHHAPKTVKQAYKKYRDCRHGFLDGIKKIRNFINELKNIDLNLKI